MSEVLHLRYGRNILRPPPAQRPLPASQPSPPQREENSGSDSDIWDQPSSSPPKLLPVTDFDPDFEQLVDVDQLATDLETGQFSALPSHGHQRETPQHPIPYISPTWLPSFVQRILALGNRGPLEDVEVVETPRLSVERGEQYCVILGIYTQSVSRAVVYLPKQLASLQLNASTFQLAHFLQTAHSRDMAAGGYLLRSLQSVVPPCKVVIPLHFNADGHPCSEYRDVIFLPDCLTSEHTTSSQITIDPVPDGPTPSQFRLEHNLSDRVNIYSIYIVQPTASGVTQTAAAFLTARYAFERDLLSFLLDGTFGVAYLHYARYRILGRIASETGLQITKPSQDSTVEGVHLTYSALLEWAGVNAGSFGNEKGLIVRSEQIRRQLSFEANISTAQKILLGHLEVLAAEPVRPMMVRPPSLQWPVAELRRQLAATVQGPRRRR
ncbi:hypothetical protein B0H11DRAFT_2376833 [Mycena galericulata]|nr:hypothetical protein B0H11DRAFT_2376833 [Mycena galericulata]